ncbi:AAA family ATPase [Microbispora sp. GKU 823]|uniref:AAA family ATPase n=1 Tax=Microbispora sp. GKU 823 TaxID=1652100 RepID=UPI0009A2BFC4|nr:AAA family ATPase [Microbispora sp. GKU 823]OPG04125.1 hypothetical protein B1L11_38500 [Microbispora sp. GKU 823]
MNNTPLGTCVRCGAPLIPLMHNTEGWGSYPACDGCKKTPDACTCEPNQEVNGTSTRRLVLTAAADIEPEPVVWVWEDDGKGRIPAGSLSVAAGREGTGKSSFGIWMAAGVTTGTLPGPLLGQPADVIYVAVEDSWKHTLVPRLIAAGADLKRVWRAEAVVSEDETGTISLPNDNDLLEREIRRLCVKLVVLDPLMSTISAKIDTHKERDTRTALDPLARLADRTGAVVLGIAHFNKGASSDPSSLITGSGAFKNVPRSVFGFAVDSESEDGGRVMTQTKNSLGLSDLPSLAYRIESTKVETRKGIADVGRFVFDGIASRSVDEILSSGGDDQEQRQARLEATDFLRQALHGQWCRTTEIQEEAKQAHGISERTLNRARKGLAVVARKFPTGPNGKSEWWLALPEQSATLPDPEGKGANA